MGINKYLEGSFVLYARSVKHSTRLSLIPQYLPRDFILPVHEHSDMFKLTGMNFLLWTKP